MLERLITSKARVEILKLLIFSQEEIHLREIARRAKISAPYVKKELQNLKKMNLLIETKKGNLKIFKIASVQLIMNEPLCFFHFFKLSQKIHPS